MSLWLFQNGSPFCVTVRYGGLSSQGNVEPTLNLLSNANPNDQRLHQVSSSGYMVILEFTCYYSTYNIFIF